MKTLRFTVGGNAKLDRLTVIFDLPAGHSCPFAKDCLSKATVNPKTGKTKLVDGKHTKFRCFAASQEVIFKNARNLRWNNFNILKNLDKAGMVAAIKAGIEAENVTEFQKFRIHSSGDFFNQTYFDAWLEVAASMPNSIFYAYTKSLPYWVNRIGEIPSNFYLNASKGGSKDELIESENLKYAEVVFSSKEAKIKELEIDKTDKLAFIQDSPFALLLHGGQPAGSLASKALQALKREGLTGYKR